MPLILKSSNNRAYVFADLNFIVSKESPVFVEDDILLFDEVKTALGEGFITKEFCEEYPGLPVVNKFSSKEERDKIIKQAEEKYEKIKKEREIEEKQVVLARICGAETTNGIRIDTEVKAVFGYGLALFDSNLNNPENGDSVSEYLFEAVVSQEFLKFAEENKVYVTKWKEEDCEQVWLVDGKTYVETTSHSFIDKKQLKPNDKSVVYVYEKLRNIIKEKHDFDIGETFELEWMLHLYYD